MCQGRKNAAVGIGRDEIPWVSLEGSAGIRDNALGVEQSRSVGSTSCVHFYVIQLPASSCVSTFDAKVHYLNLSAILCRS
jgi:hypothetical protein